MSERDEHDEWARDFCHEQAADLQDPLSRPFAERARYVIPWTPEIEARIAADRRALDELWCKQLEHQLDQARSRTSRLREALERARKMLEPHSLHPDAAGFAIIEAALADNPSDWLATKLAEERERAFDEAREYLLCVPCGWQCTGGLHVQHCIRSVVDEPGFVTIRSLGGEGAGRG